MSILYIPVGIPGCGKSTLALGLGPNAIISTDEIRGRLGDVNDQSKNDQVFAQFHFEIHTFLMGDKSVFADATNLDKRARERLLGIAKQINDIAYDVQDLTKGEMVWPVQTHLLLFRNMAQALERNQKRERTVPDDVMLRMIEKYERAVTDIGSENYDYVTEVSAVR
jgi:predicted kinase